MQKNQTASKVGHCRMVYPPMRRDQARFEEEGRVSQKYRQELQVGDSKALYKQLAV